MGRRSLQVSLGLFLLYGLSFALFPYFREMFPSRRFVESKICRMNVTVPPRSSRRDAVFFYASEFNNGLLLSVKSLRSTGCKARIIVFHPDSSNFPNVLRNMSVEYVSWHVDGMNESKSPHMSRYMFENFWLKKHISSVDRILHSDSFDVFFQADPFSEDISDSYISFVVEPHCFRSCGWNIDWMRECYGEPTLLTMFNNFIICSGTISGSSIEYLKLLDLLIGQPEWKKCWGPSIDQPILNYLIWKGFVDKEKIKYRYTGCSGGIFTMQWCVIEHEIHWNGLGQMIDSEGTAPSLLHQYNRVYGLQQVLEKRCNI